MKNSNNLINTLSNLLTFCFIKPMDVNDILDSFSGSAIRYSNKLLWFHHYIVNKCYIIQHILHFLCRFYIKCTACLSEISFRTDPANTDYVLEAGATRNFEALSKAEKQAEAEANAHKV